jgi:prevent-host-death family protein
LTIKEIDEHGLMNNLDEILLAVKQGNQSVLIRRNGTPAAALISPELFTRICTIRGRFEALSERIASAYGNVPAEQGEAEIAAAITRERHGA